MHALLKTTCETPLSIERTLRLTEQVNPVLSNECRRRLRYMHMQSFDWERGGLLSPIKFVDRDSVEYSLLAAADNDRNEERMARLTLDNATALLDPVWGGVYQYSTQGKWDVPHFRKTMAAQAGHLRIYSLAYSQLKHKHYQRVCNSIQSYIQNFMTSKHGAFYSGQADSVAGINPMLYFSLNDKKRREIGIPNIDKRLHSRENGWMIEALACYYEYCGSQQSLEMAVAATEWINSTCRTNSGGYVSSNMADRPLLLADTLAMARALFQLYRATMKVDYLKQASQSLDFIDQHFSHEICGFNSRIASKNENISPRQMDENIMLTRFARLLAHYTQKENHHHIAKHGLRYLCIPEVATARMEEAGVLLANHEMINPPLTINISGPQNNDQVREFINIAHRQPGWFKLIRFSPGQTPSASIEIDGFRSKPVSTSSELKHLLQNH